MARLFNGTNQYLSSGVAVSTFLTNSAATFCCWHKPTGTAGTDLLVYDLPGIMADSGGYLGLYRGNPASAGDKIWAFNYDLTVDQVGFTYTNDAWVHIAWRHSGGTIYVYKDGVEAGTVASGNTFDVGGTLNIGKGYSDYVNGDIAEMATWNVALDAAEIAALGKGVIPLVIRPASLTGYWPVRGTFSPEIDLKGGRNLTLINAPTASAHAPVISTTRRRVSLTPPIATRITQLPVRTLVDPSDAATRITQLPVRVLRLVSPKVVKPPKPPGGGGKRHLDAVGATAYLFDGEF